MSTTQLLSRIDSHTVGCPVELVSQLQRERQAHRNAIGSSIGEEQHNALLAHAEGIKLIAANHISDNAESGA